MRKVVQCRRLRRKYNITTCYTIALNLQEAPQCDETRFSTIQPSIDVTGIRNERLQRRKNDAVILVALVACTKFGVNRPTQT